MVARAGKAARTPADHSAQGVPRVHYVRPKVAGTVRTVPGLDDFLEVPRRDPFAEKRGRGKRGRAGVRGLSAGSRRRYLEALLPGMPAVLEAAGWGGAALLSLTYGQDAERFGVEGEEATRNRKALHGYLTRRDWCGMYCREYQERQALHWHAGDSGYVAGGERRR